MHTAIDTAVARLGAAIRAERLRRKITTVEMARRLEITRVTLGNLEKGDPNVRIGLYAAALQEFGCLEQLAGILTASE